MKLTFQKILVCVLALVVSVAACVFGMYMVFLANMIIGYRFLFSIVFMLNPVLVIFMIRFMFKKPVPKDAPPEGGPVPPKKKRNPFAKAEEPEMPPAPEPVPEPVPEPSYEPAQNEAASYTETSFSDASYEEPSFAEEPTEFADDFDAQPVEKASVPVTEDSVGGIKKISLRRKKRNTEDM